jgi:hypothetical protein
MVDSGPELSQLLPYIDEHTIRVSTEPERVWDALGEMLRQPFGRAASMGASLLGVRPARRSGDPLIEGSTLPGFDVVRARAPGELRLQGQHRFSRYALIFRLDALDGGTSLRAETRAAFPGPFGRVYQALVIDSHAHRVAVRRLLHATRKISGRSSASESLTGATR